MNGRIATLMVHTSPLDQPGIGDAGGMNIYVTESAERMAAMGVEVDIFTRRTNKDVADIVEISPGVRVRHLNVGPVDGVTKERLPELIGELSEEFTRLVSQDSYDVIHSHYWISGKVAMPAAEKLGIPLVHTMHTMARVKNLTLAQGDSPEPAIREIGEEQVVIAADRLVANTHAEAKELIELYHADPNRVRVVHPGVDLDLFVPGDQDSARSALGLADDAIVLLFVGRIQPLKAPDVLIEAAAEILNRNPELRSRLVVAICGGPSGSGLERPDALITLAADLGVSDVMQFVPPTNRTELVKWYQSATVCVVPSYSESFGLVAIEAQACGTPVVAARSAPTKITAMATPPLTGPKTCPTVSSRSSAIPERSKIIPMNVKKGIAKRVSFCIMPKIRNGNA